MEYGLLVLTTCFITLQGIFSKQYSLKAKSYNSPLYTGTKAFAAMVFFLVNARFKLDLNLEVLPYSVIFAVAYSVSSLSMISAVKCGPFALSCLIQSYSLIIPTAYGIVFLKEEVTAFTWIGIGLLLVSLFLINIKNEKIKLSFKWIVFISLAFFGNGFCSAMSKVHTNRFQGAYMNEYMVVALLLVSITLITVALVRAKGKIALGECVKFSLPDGIANGIVNLAVLILTGVIPNALLFPCVSAGGIVLSFLVAVFIYKERLSKMQLVGYALGVLSVIALNL